MIFDLNDLQSYQVVLTWKVYIIDNSNGINMTAYSVSMSNIMNNSSTTFFPTHNYSCGNSTIYVDKGGTTLTSITNNNTLTFTSTQPLYIA